MQWARGKFSTLVTGGIISFIAFVFVVSGVFNPKATRGLHEGAVAGTVNGDSISISEFNRALSQRMEFFKNLGGGFTEEQLKAFRVKESVFDDLVRRKLMVQEAKRQGLQASDEEVRERIREIPAFQKDGRFDVTTYKQVLTANNYNPGSFERMIREDISLQGWQNYFQSRVKVSDEEIRRKFLVDEDKRNIKYVLLTSEAGRRGVKVEEADVTKFLADPAKLNLAKNQFDRKKETEFKGKTFEMVKNSIAHSILAGEKLDEVKKVNEKLGDQVLGLLASGSDAKVNALLKPYQVEAKTTGLVSSEVGSLPGIGSAPELMKDAFAAQSPIVGKAKKYVSSQWVLVALVTDAKKPDLARLESERGKVLRELTMKKQRELHDEWLKKLTAKAKVDRNPSVISES